MDNNKITELFNNFVGKEVSVEKSEYQALGHTFYKYAPADNDPVFKEIQEIADKNKIELAYEFRQLAGVDPNSHGSNENRITVYASKPLNGKYRITSFAKG